MIHFLNSTVKLESDELLNTATVLSARSMPIAKTVSGYTLMETA